MSKEFSFTGPSSLTPAQVRWCKARLRKLNHGVLWRSGCAFGLDTLVAKESDKVVLYVPRGEVFNHEVLKLFRIARVHSIDGGYRPRNVALVKGSYKLHAFLFSPVFYRSGEWMTVNIARRLGVPVRSFIIPS